MEEGDLHEWGKKEEEGGGEVRKRARTPTSMHTVSRTSKASGTLGSEKKEKWHEKDSWGRKERKGGRGRERGGHQLSV